ncbi:MAG: VWA domain-containing protein, partial [Firmicutes bacterium]|nr:VWA domain-containing protein [Bacillota bacterium]
MRTREDRGFYRRLIRISLLLILTFAILLTGAFSGQAKAAGKGRRIHVVFDDSGSMNTEQRWSRAMYALEVFTAMLEEEDELKAYTLNLGVGEAIQISGKDADRTKKVHQWGANHDGGGTSFKRVEDAAGELQRIKNNYSDVWLVVLTDGEFDQGSSYIENKLNSWNQQGIRTVYLAIGNRAYPVSSNPGNGGYAYKANDSKAILENVRDIANRIFERLILPASHIRQNGNTYTLNIDVPTQHIIVFAQGEGVRIGNLTASGRSLAPDERQDVQYATNIVYGFSDTTLKGTVVTFKDHEAGTFTIDVAGSQQVEFYYDPAVEVGCELKTSKNDPNGISPGSEIEEGRYFVSGAYIDSRKHTVITSDLLDPSLITLTLDNNGKIQRFGSSGGEVDLQQGTVDIEAVADLKTTELRDSKTYTVAIKKSIPTLPADTVLSVRQDLLKGNNTYKFRFIMVDSKTGQPLNEERWKNTTLEIVDQHGVKWDWTKDGMTAPNIEVTPSAAGDYTAVDTGTWQFTVTSITNNDERARLDADFSFTVMPFEPIRVEDVPVSLSQKLLKNGTSEIIVHILDPYKNNAPVTGDRWMHVTNLTVNDGDGIAWDCRRGSADGEYILTPRSADGKLHSVNPGTHEFTVTGTYDDGDLKNWTTTGKLTLTVTNDPDRKLDLKIDVPSEPYPQSRYHMKNAQPILVTAYYNGQVIEDRLWQLADEDTDFEIELADPDQKLEFEIKKGLKAGTWEICPKPWHNRGYETSHGRIRFKVDINILDDEILYEGIASEELEVSEEMFWCTLEWIEDNLYWI